MMYKPRQSEPDILHVWDTELTTSKPIKDDYKPIIHHIITPRPFSRLSDGVKHPVRVIRPCQ